MKTQIHGIVFDQLCVEVEGNREIRIVAWADELIGTVAVEAAKRSNGPFFSVGCYEPLRVAGIRQLFVRPDWRNKGVGTDLLEQACEVARLAGCRSVNLSVQGGNDELLNFYEKRGWLLTIEYGDGTFAMAKALVNGGAA